MSCPCRCVPLCKHPSVVFKHSEKHIIERIEGSPSTCKTTQVLQYVSMQRHTSGVFHQRDRDDISLNVLEATQECRVGGGHWITLTFPADAFSLHLRGERWEMDNIYLPVTQACCFSIQYSSTCVVLNVCHQVRIYCKHPPDLQK